MKRIMIAVVLLIGTSCLAGTASAQDTPYVRPPVHFTWNDVPDTHPEISNLDEKISAYEADLKEFERRIESADEKNQKSIEELKELERQLKVAKEMLLDKGEREKTLKMAQEQIATFIVMALAVIVIYLLISRYAHRHE